MTQSSHMSNTSSLPSFLISSERMWRHLNKLFFWGIFSLTCKAHSPSWSLQSLQAKTWRGKRVFSHSFSLFQYEKLPWIVTPEEQTVSFIYFLLSFTKAFCTDTLRMVSFQRHRSGSSLSMPLEERPKSQVFGLQFIKSTVLRWSHVRPGLEASFLRLREKILRFFVQWKFF